MSVFSFGRWPRASSELSRGATLEVSPKKSKSRPTRRKARRRIPAWVFSVILHFSAVALLSFFGLRGDEPPSITPNPLKIALSPGQSTPSLRQAQQPAHPPSHRTWSPSTDRLERNPPLPQIPSGASSPQIEAPDFPVNGSTSQGSTYLGYLRSQIESHKKYPREAVLRREEGLVEVSLTLQKNGRLTDLSISQSASPVLDRAALDAIRALPDLPAPPADLQAPLNLKIPIRFELRPHFRK